MPEIVRAANHRTMSGPKAPATRSVPFFWIEKSRMAMPPAITTREVWFIPSSPLIRSMPSTALRILMAGVMTPSPMMSEMPMNESMVTTVACLPDLRSGTRSSRSTMVPPSPRLPRLMASQAYSTVTRMMSVQTMRDRTPIDVVLGAHDRRQEKDDGERVDRARADVAEHEAEGLYDSFGWGCFIRHT